jgi:GT2 family glycosyltransferase
MISASIVLYNSDFNEVIGAINDFMMSKCAGQLFLVDNSPSVSKNFADFSANNERVSYEFLNKNVGYGSAHNFAMKRAYDSGYKHHIVLNPDVRFGSDVLEGLLQKMKSDRSLAHIMPKISYPDGSIQYLCKRLPSPFDLVLRRFVPIAQWRRYFEFSYELRCYDYERELVNVPALSGCFMFLRLDAVKNVGYFDENIFMYMEDVDLTRRLLEHYSNLYCPKFTVYHKYEKGSYKNSRLLKYHICSAIYYFRKWGWFFDEFRSRSNQGFEEKNRANLL